MKVDIVVATWFVFCAVVFVPLTASYKTLNFNAESTDANTYKALVTQLRLVLESGDVIYDYPVLPSHVPVDSEARFVLVDMHSEDRRARIALDVIDANVVGFAADANSYFLRDVSDAIYDSPLFDLSTF